MYTHVFSSFGLVGWMTVYWVVIPLFRPGFFLQSAKYYEDCSIAITRRGNGVHKSGWDRSVGWVAGYMTRNA